MTASVFKDVPDDILRLIIDASSKHDFIRISMVNTRFYTLLESQIYHTIDWVWQKDSIPPITLLLRTILARPELAKHIRSVKLTGETFHLPPFRMKLPPKIPIAGPELDRIVAVVMKLEVPDGQLWIKMLGGGTDPVPADNIPLSSMTRFATMDALLAVLLSRLPNLTSLHLGPNFTKETTILGAMFKHALCDEKAFGLPKFEMLKEAKFMPRICIERQWGKRANDRKPGNSICPLTFFSAPAIEHITATIAEPETFKWPSTPPSPTTLISLSITLLREGTLGHILSRCTNLDALAYHFYADKASRGSSDRVQRSLRSVLYSSRLLSSVAFVESRLKSLVLGTYVTEDDFEGFEAEPEGVDTPINFRHTFAQLTNIEIPVVFLLGYDHPGSIDIGDVLPRNVRTVSLTDDTFWGRWESGWNDEPEMQVLDFIEKWFESWRMYTPLLEKVRLHSNEVAFGFSREAVQRFKNMGLRAGLAVEFTNDPQNLDRYWPRVGRLES